MSPDDLTLPWLDDTLMDARQLRNHSPMVMVDRPRRRRPAVWMAVAIVVSVPGVLSAQPLANEAVEYRVKGYELQRQGDVTGARANYQKAMAIDPTYATPHNDVGILLEAEGELDRAEEEYRAAIQADPNYLEAYTNLALLHEKRGQKEQAIYYWLRRASMGHPLDAWTIKAKERLIALGVFEKKEDLEWSIQEVQQESALMIAQEYSKAKDLLAAGQYFEAILSFERVIHLEQEFRPIYTPYAQEYLVRAQAALEAAERRGLNPAAAAAAGSPVGGAAGPLPGQETVVQQELGQMQQSLRTFEETTNAQGEWNRRPFP